MVRGISKSRAGLVEGQTTSAGGRTAAVRSGSTGPDRSVEELMAECDRLRAELASAEERIATLEKACSEAADRVAWVIDSLHSLTEEERTS